MSVPIFASGGHARIAAPVTYVHLNQPSESRCGDLPSFSNDSQSRELARASCHCSLARAGLWFSFASLCSLPEHSVLVTFVHKVPVNNVSVGTGTLPLVSTFASIVAFLAVTLTAFDSRGNRPSGPLRRSMGKIHAGLGPFEPKDLSHRWVFVFVENTHFETDFFFAH